MFEEEKVFHKIQAAINEFRSQQRAFCPEQEAPLRVLKPGDGFYIAKDLMEHRYIVIDPKRVFPVPKDTVACLRISDAAVLLMKRDTVVVERDILCTVLPTLPSQVKDADIEN